MRKTVVIGSLGSTLDKGRGAKRWERWRPTVGVCQQANLLVDRFHIFYHERHQTLTEQLEDDIVSVSPETEVVFEAMEMANPWDFEEVFSTLLDFAERYPFAPEKEDYLFHITTGTHMMQICMFLLTEAGFFPGKLLQSGPGPQNTAPGSCDVIDLDLSKYDKIASRFALQLLDDISFLKSGIDTRNAAFNQLIERIERVGRNSSDPILLTGPTGAGKSQLAKQIHELKRQHRRVTGRFVEVNCATLRGDMAMSVLFGHKKGAFTGAVNDRQGLLKAADGGILFLDEIGELGADEQAMLLRAIEEGCFMPMGSDAEIESHFQLICGTNRDLGKDVAEGRFREDLLARIKLWTFQLPGLSRRREDIAPNIDYELTRYTKRENRRVRFNKEAREKYERFALSPEAKWTANFRDLNSSIIRLATLADGGRINTDLVDEEIQRLQSDWDAATDSDDDRVIRDVIGDDRLMNLDLFDRTQLATVIRVCRESKSLAGAGRILFAASRKKRATVNDSDRVRKYLARFDITWDRIFP